MVLDGKSSQEYLVNAGVSEGFIVSPTLFLLYINYLPDDFICNIAIYADDNTLYSKFYLIYGTPQTKGGCGLLISMLEKRN